MALVQDHTASELWSSLQMSLLRGMGEEAGLGSSSRSGAELESRSPRVRCGVRESSGIRIWQRARIVTVLGVVALGSARPH